MVILNATKHKHVLCFSNETCWEKVFSVIFLNITETPITTWNHFNYVTKVIFMNVYFSPFYYDSKSMWEKLTQNGFHVVVCWINIILTLTLRAYICGLQLYRLLLRWRIQITKAIISCRYNVKFYDIIKWENLLNFFCEMKISSFERKFCEIFCGISLKFRGN